MKTQTVIIPRGCDEHGEVINPNRDAIIKRLVGFLESLPINKPWKIEISRYVKTRSNEQNAYLFGVCYAILEEATGYTKEELHEVFCRKHFGSVEREALGVTVTRPRRTTTTDERGKHKVMNTVEFWEFVELVVREASGLGVYIPPPKKQE